MMMAEYQARDSYARTAQAQALARSGVHYAAAMLSDANAVSGVLNNNPWDNPTAFRDVLVATDNTGRTGRFSIVSLRSPSDPSFSPTNAYRFGVTDEARKLNLNALLTLAQTETVRLQMLMQIPNMTEDVANSILDWHDGPTTIPRTNAARAEYYTPPNP